jgi:hypothetical protein
MTKPQSDYGQRIEARPNRQSEQVHGCSAIRASHRPDVDLSREIKGAKIIVVPSWSHARIAPCERGWRYNFAHDQESLPRKLYTVSGILS